MQKVKDYFKRYPNNSEVFENGGKLFHTRGAADSFGGSETKRYTRPTAPQGGDLENSNDSKEIKESVILKIKETDDFSTVPYEQLKAWVKIIDLNPEDNKKETFLKAFADFKETLKDK